VTRPSFVIGIAGGTGTGKTAVAHEVKDAVGEAVTRLSLDNYYRDLSHLPREERESVNYGHPSAFGCELLVDYLERLLAGETIEMPQYDFTVHNRKPETVTVEPTPIVVVEGILALYESDARELFDLSSFRSTPTCASSGGSSAT